MAVYRSHYVAHDGDAAITDDTTEAFANRGTLQSCREAPLKAARCARVISPMAGFTPFTPETEMCRAPIILSVDINCAGMSDIERA